MREHRKLTISLPSCVALSNLLKLPVPKWPQTTLYASIITPNLKFMVQETRKCDISQHREQTI